MDALGCRRAKDGLETGTVAAFPCFRGLVRLANRNQGKATATIQSRRYNELKFNDMLTFEQPGRTNELASRHAPT